MALLFSKRKHSSLFFYDFDFADHQFFKDKCHRFCQLFIFFRKGRLIYWIFFSILPNILIEKKWRETCSVRSQGVSFFMSVFRVSGFFHSREECGFLSSTCLPLPSRHLPIFPDWVRILCAATCSRGAGLWDKVNPFSIIHLWLNNRDLRGLGC